MEYAFTGGLADYGKRGYKLFKPVYTHKVQKVIGSFSDCTEIAESQMIT